MKNLMLKCLCGFNDREAMNALYFFLRNSFHFIPLCFFCLLLSRCDSSNGSEKLPGEIPQVTPHIIRTLPHDTLAFTQGLLYHNGKIFESTGLRGQSSLRCINAADGSIQKKIPVAGIFAEGIALKGNFLVQLTWRSGRAIMYRYPDLQNVDYFSYGGEGWGLTTDGKFYIMSNGSDTLFWRDNAFNVMKKTAVTLEGSFYVTSTGNDTLRARDTVSRVRKKTKITLHKQPLTNLNELEYVRGRIFANVLYNDFIFEIHHRSGNVLKIIDCSNLVAQIDSLGEQDVLNGIAYNKEEDTFFLTGKNWPLIFEVKIPEK